MTPLTDHGLRLAFVAASVCLGMPCLAADDDDLQKKLANPLADIVTVPLQLTTTGETGPLKRPQHALNVQPVYPMQFGSGMLIHRVIVPLLSVPAAVPGQERENGLGDITYEVFYSPPPKGDTVWGVGPVVQLRTATDDRLGTGKWSAGPAFVFVKQPGQWSWGALLTHLWSFAGSDDRRRVSQTQLQPLLSYRVDAQHTWGYMGTLTANWEESRSSERWTVPLGVSYTTLVRTAGHPPVSYLLGAGYNVVRPDGAGTWFLRLQVTFVLPK